ncbi:hypothetical protein FB451DRAFT_82497 [Mycena latifolia]|nr:hypothetical protein FB451DRAFT_82497 [Mycena latifolia]
MQSSYPWHQLPPELLQEITGHNADDVPTLRALSLVSKTMRSMAIKELFSIIHFACAEDFARWLDMLGRTPGPGNIVQKVKFSDLGPLWLERHRGLDKATNISRAAIPPIILHMPNVRVVEWDLNGGNFKLGMPVAYMALFPNIQRLYLSHMPFSSVMSLANFIAACGSLKVISFLGRLIDSGPQAESDPGDSDAIGTSLQLCPLNFAELEELSVASTYTEGTRDFLVHLVKHSPPVELKSLSFERVMDFDQDPCSIPAMEELLKLAASSLVNLAVEPTLWSIPQDQIPEMFGRLPAFPSLQSLTIWLSPNRQAEWLVKALTAALNLHTLIFRIGFTDHYDINEHRRHLDEILRVAFPWDTSESLKSLLKDKFPLLRRIGFHFSLSHTSDMHFRRGLRRRMERRLRGHLDQAGADVAEYLELEWFDEKYNPATYSKTSGKPPWEVSRHYWNPEPQTEASDCESDKSDKDSDDSDDADDSDDEAFEDYSD